MRGYTARLLLAALICSVALAGATPATAQDDKKLSGEETDWIGAPPPEDCSVDPVTLDDLVGAIADDGEDGDQDDAVALTIAIPTEDDLPAGDQVDDDVVEDVSATLWEAVACINGGDFARFFALMSPNGMRFFYMSILEALGRPPGPLTDEEVADLETDMAETLGEVPTPAAEEDRARIDAIRDARELEDGRVLVVVEGTIIGEGAAFAALREIDDRWLIDAIGIIGDLPGLSL